MFCMYYMVKKEHYGEVIDKVVDNVIIVHKSQLTQLFTNCKWQIPRICICDNDVICEQLGFVNNQVAGRWFGARGT